MFDNITAPRAKRRAGPSMAVSVFLHGLVVGAAFLFAYARAHMPKQTEAPVAVTFRPPPPPPPPPPAPPAGHKPKPPGPSRVKPQTLPPTTVIQPKETPKVEEKGPEPVEEPEED